MYGRHLASGMKLYPKVPWYWSMFMSPSSIEGTPLTPSLDGWRPHWNPISPPSGLSTVNDRPIDGPLSMVMPVNVPPGRTTGSPETPSLKIQPPVTPSSNFDFDCACAGTATTIARTPAISALRIIRKLLHVGGQADRVKTDREH